jgi:hypothetical protein
VADALARAPREKGASKFATNGKKSLI